MKERSWMFIVFFTLVASGLGFGWMGFDIGWDEGHEVGVVEGFNEAELLYQAPPDIPKYLKIEGPTWEETLGDILEGIDTANITIHIESEDTKADLHIFWDK